MNLAVEVREACQSALPLDYEACGTCTFDHAYDWPYLSVNQKEQAIAAHVEAGDGVDS